MPLIFRPVNLFLLLLALARGPLAQVTATVPFQEPAPQAGRYLIAPFWSTLDGFETRFVLTNPAGHTGLVTLTLFSGEGRPVTSRSFEYSEQQSFEISFARDLMVRGTGWYRVEYPSEVHILPAQTVVSRGEASWVEPLALEETLLPSREQTLYGLLQTGSGRDAFLTATNPGQSTAQAQVSLSCRTARTTRLSIPSGHSRTFRLSCPGGPVSGGSTLTISSDSPLAFSAFSGEPPWLSQGIPLLRLPRNPSGKLAGFYQSATTQIVLRNFSQQALTLPVQAKEPSGETRSAEVRLKPGEITVRKLSELFELRPDSPGVFLLHHPVDHPILGVLVAPTAGAMATPLKDLRAHTSLGYGFPVRLSEDQNTLLRILNPNPSEVTVCVFLAFGESRYTHPLKSLQPGELVELDLRQARDNQLEGENGELIPLDASIGQAVVVLHEPAAQFNLLAQAVAETRHNPKLLFSCSACPPELVAISLSPDPIEGYVGFDKDLRVLAYFSNGYTKNVTAASWITSGRPSVVTVTNGTAILRQAGLTDVTASFSDCNYRPDFGSEPEPGGGFSCFCEGTITEYDRSVAISKSPIFEVVVTTFIPDNWVGVPSFAPESYCYAPEFRNLVFRGDDRSFRNWASTSAYRTRQIAVLDVDPHTAPEKLELNLIQPTRSYADDALSVDNRIDPSDDDGISGDCHLWHQQGFAETTSMSASTTRSSNSKQTHVRFSGAPSNPLLPSPSIDWDLTVSIDASGPKATYSIQGQWDGYPSLEIHIGSLDVYRLQRGDTPFCLFPGICDVTVSKSGVLQ